MEKATLTEINEKVQAGLLRTAQVIGDDMKYIEILRYLESTWSYLYQNLLVVGVDIYAMEFRTEEKIKSRLDEMRDIIKDRMVKNAPPTDKEPTNS